MRWWVRIVLLVSGLALLVLGRWLGLIVVGPVALPPEPGAAGATPGWARQGIVDLLRLVLDFAGIGLLVCGCWKESDRRPRTPGASKSTPP